IIAQAIFGVIGIIGMARPIGHRDLRIILRSLVDILDHQADRRAGRPPLEHARQDADPVRLLPLRREARRARPALVEPGLEIGLRQGKPRRAAIDHGAQRRPVALPPGGEAEDAAEAVERHQASAMSGASSAFMPMTLYPASTWWISPVTPLARS